MCWARGRRMAQGETAAAGQASGNRGSHSGTGPGPACGAPEEQSWSAGALSLETLWGCSEPCLRARGPLHPPSGATLRVLPGFKYRLPSSWTAAWLPAACSPGLGKRSKNRFQDCLKSVGELGAQMGLSLALAMGELFEFGRSYFSKYGQK